MGGRGGIEKWDEERGEEKATQGKIRRKEGCQGARERKEGEERAMVNRKLMEGRWMAETVWRGRQRKAQGKGSYIGSEAGRWSREREKASRGRQVGR